MGWVSILRQHWKKIRISENNKREISPVPRDRGTINLSDNPIQRAEEDTLARTPLAHLFARNVLSLDASEGIVVGVLGPWGSGKTSFINLARDEFTRGGVPILDFNPWMFGGAEELVERFFAELAAQMRVRPTLAAIAESIADYGETLSGPLKWLPVIGQWVEAGGGVSKALRNYLRRRKKGVGGKRVQLKSVLAKLANPIVVVVDDIDRLSSPEIRDIFKLVRLTASFPNIIYVLAFDRSRIESALDQEGFPGRDYLEKIIQIAIDLPAVPPKVFTRQILLAIEQSLSGIDKPGPFKQEVWPDIFAEIVRPLVNNMRDLRRYAAAIRGTVSALDGQIALADVLGLEAIRIFLPDVYSLFPAAIEGLTTTSGIIYGNRPDPPYLKASVEALIERAGSHRELIRSMVKRLFPGGERHIGGMNYGADWKVRWLKERRVAHEEIMSLYLEGVLGEGLRAFTDAERAFSLMPDRIAFDNFLRSLNNERAEDVIAALENFEKEFSGEHAVAGSIVLLNQIRSLPDRVRGFFDLDGRLVVRRVVLRLLRAMGTPNAVEAAVRTILPELTSLSAKLELITLIGHRDQIGHKLVSEPVAAELEKGWRSAVRASSLSDLEQESRLLHVLLVVKRQADANEPPLEIPESPGLTLAILRSAQTEVRSQSIDSRAIRTSRQLAWDAIMEVLGGEEGLRRRINLLKENLPTGEDELLGLADKYLTGWRPRDFDEG